MCVLQSSDGAPAPALLIVLVCLENWEGLCVFRLNNPFLFASGRSHMPKEIWLH